MNRKIFTTVCILLIVTLFIPLFNGKASPQSSKTVAQTTPALVWVDQPSMPTARYNMGVAATNDGKIYVVGGDNWSCTPLNNLEVYNPSTNSWSVLSPMPTSRWGVRSAALDGKIYAIGGFSVGCGEQLVGTVEVYDPTNDTWETRSPLPAPRANMGIVAANGKIYSMGGISDNVGGVASTVDEYDPLTDTWTSKTDMPTINLSFGIAAADNGKIYIFGGGMKKDAAYAYDPTSDSWAEAAMMPTPRDVFGAVKGCNGNIFAVGGFGDSPTGAVEEYYPQTDSWAVQTALPYVNPGLGVAASRSSIYSIGGFGYNPDGSPAGALNTVVAASLECALQVGIDIKPQNNANAINLYRLGTVPVAVLSNPGFDAPSEVMISSLTFGRTGYEDSISLRIDSKPMQPVCQANDVNQDGIFDLICTYKIPSTGFQCGDTQGILRGHLLSGEEIMGSDAVTITPCK